MKTVATLALVSFSVSLAVRAQTNQFYVTDERPKEYGSFVSTAEQIEQARKAKYSRPANDDPEGNWGAVSEGFQLSIRFPKESFTNGEAIVASILLRNVTNTPLTYYVSFPRDVEQELVLKKQGQRLLGKDEITPDMTFKGMLSHLARGSRGDATCPVGTQRKFIVELSSVFNLTTNGEYVVQAKRNIMNLERTAIAEVVSGSASFRITAPSK